MNIILEPPRVEGNRVTFSWSGGGVFARSSYWVEYPGLDRIEASCGKLAEAYFPVCLAFAALPGARVRLPAKVDARTLEVWRGVIDALSRNVFKKKASLVIENGEDPAGYKTSMRSETALLFGGGTESLLTLSRLRKQGLSPLLVSIGGSGWAGSDPERNPDKFRLDEEIAKDLSLRLVKIRTNVRDLFDEHAWSPHLKRDETLFNSALFVPFCLAAVFPVSEQLGIGEVAQGNEKVHVPTGFFCFTPGMTHLLSQAGRDVSYGSYVGELFKEDVCRELYRNHPQWARYQYSCWRNQGERWCHRCDACLRTYLLLRESGLSPQEVGMDEERIRTGIKRLIFETARSEDAEPGEIWDRLRRSGALHDDPFARKTLETVHRLSWAYRTIYKRLPSGLKRGLGLTALMGALKQGPFSQARTYFIIGGYTYSNPGDEAILKTTLRLLNELHPGSHFVIWTDKRDFHVRLETGLSHEFIYYDPLPLLSGGSARAGWIRGLYRWTFRVSAPLFQRFAGRIARVLSRMRASEDILFVGGGYMNSGHNLAELHAMYRLARESGRPVYLMGQSIGPFTRAMDRRMVDDVLGGAEAVLVRDESSAQEAGKFHSKTIRGYDDALAFSAGPTESGKAVLEKYLGSSVPGTVYLGLNLRGAEDLEGSFEPLLRALNGFQAMLGDKKLKVLFLPMETSRYCDDREWGRRFGRLSGRQFDYAVVEDALSVEERFALASKMDLCAGMRFHALVFSLAQGVPSVGFHSGEYYRRKIEGILEQFDSVRYSLPLNALSRLPELLRELYDKRRTYGAFLRERSMQAQERQRRIYRELFA